MQFKLNNQKALLKTVGINLLVIATLITAVNLLSAITLLLWDQFRTSDSQTGVSQKSGTLGTFRTIFNPTDRLITRIRGGNTPGEIKLTISQNTQAADLTYVCSRVEGLIHQPTPEALSETEYSKLLNALPPEYQLKVKLPNQPKNAVTIYSEELQLPKAYSPFRTWQRTSFSGKAHNYGADGFRTHRIFVKKTNDAKTIGFFGGSTMEGFGVDDQGTIPAEFDNRTNSCSSKNFGVYSYNSRQGLETLINLINTGTHLDAIVFYDGINDVTETCKGNFSVNTDSQESIIRERLGFSPLTSNLTCHIDPERARLAAQVLIQNWLHAKAIANANNVRFIAILQPVSFIGNPRTDHIRFDGTGFLDQGLRDQFTAVYPILKASLEEAKYPWAFDFTNTMDGDKYLYLDFAHLSSEGNQIVADRILNILSSWENKTP